MSKRKRKTKLEIDNLIGSYVMLGNSLNTILREEVIDMLCQFPNRSVNLSDVAYKVFASNLENVNEHNVVVVELVNKRHNNLFLVPTSALISIYNSMIGELTKLKNKK